MRHSVERSKHKHIELLQKLANFFIFDYRNKIKRDTCLLAVHTISDGLTLVNT